MQERPTSNALEAAAGEHPVAMVRPPDVLSALRVPLAVVFLLAESAAIRLGVLVLVGVSDLADGYWARRIGSSRIGVVLDAVVDKLFMATAFFAVWQSGALPLIEILAALLRDLLATAGFLVSLLLRRPTTIPSRAGGKAVTACQLLALLAFVAGSDLLRPLVWAAAAISLYAMADYARVAASRSRSKESERRDG